MVENYCTTREAARLLGISVRSVQQWVDKGRLHAWKTAGGHRRIDRESVMTARRQRAGQAAASEYSLPILIVEDDAALLKLYRLQMARWPFPVTLYTAPNGFEGLVMVGEAAPQLLICDLRLPGVSGFQIVRYLSAMERHAGMTLVVVSGLPPDEIAAHGSLPPRTEIMGKPIDFGRLQAMAHDLWRKHAGTEAPD